MNSARTEPPETAPDGSPGRYFTGDGMDVWPVAGLRYGDDAQADAQPGDQVADTDGLAKERVVTGDVPAMWGGLAMADEPLRYDAAGLDRVQTASRMIVAGGPTDFAAAVARLEAEVAALTKMLCDSDAALSNRPSAAASSLPARALRPLPQRGGLCCGPFA